MAHSRSNKKLKYIRNSFLIYQLAHSFIKNGFIRTSISRAKALRMFLEPIITIAKKADDLYCNNENSVSLRRLLVKKLKSKDLAKDMADKIAPHFRSKNKGGYLRITKTRNKQNSSIEAYLSSSVL